MIAAFQRSAFQLDAFQIGVTVGGGGQWPIVPTIWQRAQMELARREREEEKREEEEVAEPALEIVTAQAAPIVTDLAIMLAAPAPLAKPRDRELDEFLALMVKLAQSEDEYA